MKYLLHSLILLIASPTWATELFEVNKSVRALGMGNAYSSVVNDSDALFYNPAGIGLNSGVYWTIADPQVGLNGADALTSVQDFQNASDFPTALAGLAGKKIWAGGGGKTAARFPYFAGAVYNNIDASFAIDDPTNQELELNYVNDFGYALGLGIGSIPFTSIGVVARQITRTGVRSVYDPLTLNFNSFDADLATESTATAIDVGVIFSIDTVVTPAISYVIRNLGDTEFEVDSGTAAATTDEEEHIAGVSMATDLGLVSVTPSLDIKHLNKSDIDFGRKINVGVEFGLPLVDLRAGYSQGYWTAGFGIGFGPLQVDIASWGVELGDEVGELEDRRYALQATIEFGLDVGIGGSSSSRGKKGGGNLRQQRRAKRKVRR